MRSPTGRQRSWAAAAWCALGAIVGLAVFHGSQFASGWTLLPGDELDARFVAFVLEHIRRSVLGQADFLSPPIFFPETRALAYSDLHLLEALPHLVLRAAGLPTLVATSVSIIALSAVTWVVTYCFLYRGLGFRAAAATLGAYVFTFSSPKLNQLFHLQHQVLVLVAASAWCLVWFFRSAAAERTREAWIALAGFALLIHLQLWTSFQIAWFWILDLSIAFGFAICRHRRARSAVRWAREHRGGLLAFLAANAAALTPLVLVFRPTVAARGWRSWNEVSLSLPRPRSYVAMGTNLVWAELSRSAHERLPMTWEHALGFGFVGSAALVAAFAWGARQYFRSGLPALCDAPSPASRRDLTALACIVSLTLFVVTLQVRGFSAWWLVYNLVPGAAAIRTISRSALLSSLGLSLFCAYCVDEALAALAQRRRHTRILGQVGLAVLAATFVVEQIGRAPVYDRRRAEARVERLIGRVRTHPDCEVFAIVLPPEEQRPEVAQVDAMFAALESGRPTVNGYSSLGPSGWRLWRLRDPQYHDLVREWLASRHSSAKLCFVDAP